MKIAIHQPNFLPWLGYFYKIANVDTFVLLDDVQFAKNSFINRNKIKTPQGVHWLTLPVLQKGKSLQKINEVEIHNPKYVFNKILKTTQSSYAKAPFFQEIQDLLCSTLIDSSNICSLNEKLILAIVEYLNIECNIVLSSNLSITETCPTKRLVNICKTLNANTYLAGFGSVKYQDNLIFYENGIKTELYNFKHPIYNQLWGTFTPNLSIVDLLFNHGKNSHIYLK